MCTKHYIVIAMLVFLVIYCILMSLAARKKDAEIKKKYVILAYISLSLGIDIFILRAYFVLF